MRSMTNNNQLVSIEIQFHSNFFNISGFTPLHIACENASLGVLELLLKRGANATSKNDNGETALQIFEKKREVNTF